MVEVGLCGYFDHGDSEYLGKGRHPGRAYSRKDDPRAACFWKAVATVRKVSTSIDLCAISETMRRRSSPNVHAKKGLAGECTE